MYSSKSACFIQAFRSHYSVCDVWRSLHSQDREYCSNEAENHQIGGTEKQYVQTHNPTLYERQLELKTKFHILTTHSLEHFAVFEKSSHVLYIWR